MMCNYTDRHRGFTILELLVVIVIIGILAAIALPKFSGVREDANIAVSKSNLKSLQTAIERYKLDNSVYPDQLATLISEGYIKRKICIIPGTTDPYQYGADNTDFLIYDTRYNLYATSEGIEEDFSTYAGGITPTAQTI
ncbi:hypothetical protein BBF96_09330 [Anoxybacter fermentans]|uniref:Type II secretion system protein GspG C-terminal domain-containing protein n=1 Tax=Anoxybacter fermentans TaxID=1323375 RepID=A0A3Q9HQT6_9FIRM|nr:prepilin-type N-terminal cleavage/methylation domain-containing protein [Anoxybacter fermentans]AZR73573.1 hypothetical protein BBF96_09330 [Anoxybacter fermentans]